MGSQTPDVPVRFAASFGRRLLYDPAYNRVNIECRGAWFEANLIATEFDGRFPIPALEMRLKVTGADPMPVLQALQNAGLIEADDDPEWMRIVGWEKYQPEPFGRSAKDPTGAERQRRYRERHVTVRNGSNGDVTPHARTSESSSSSLSKTIGRTRPREERRGSTRPMVIGGVVAELREHLLEQERRRTS